MKLTTAQSRKIKEYARRDYPNETCGIITEAGRVVSLANIAEDPTKDFMLPKNTFIKYKVKAVYHSHPDADENMSEQDMRSQINTAVPWILCSVFENSTTEPFVWGGSYIPPLLGRTFRHGASGTDNKGDCYALIKDWYFIERNVKLSEYPRSYNWWEEGKNLYADFFQDAGFEEVVVKDNPEIGDVALIKINSVVENHAALFIENEMFLHQLYGRESRREPAARWRKMISRWVRYVKNN